MNELERALLSWSRGSRSNEISQQDLDRDFQWLMKNTNEGSRITSEVFIEFSNFHPEKSDQLLRFVPGYQESCERNILEKFEDLENGIFSKYDFQEWLQINTPATAILSPLASLVSEEIKQRLRDEIFNE